MPADEDCPVVDGKVETPESSQRGSHEERTDLYEKASLKSNLYTGMGSKETERTKI